MFTVDQMLKRDIGALNTLNALDTFLSEPHLWAELATGAFIGLRPNIAGWMQQDVRNNFVLPVNASDLIRPE